MRGARQIERTPTAQCEQLACPHHVSTIQSSDCGDTAIKQDTSGWLCTDCHATTGSNIGVAEDPFTDTTSVAQKEKLDGMT
jgi:hypothetical protein